jgi:hypothetical protein
MCLVTDAAGTATYKRHVFSDIESATDFVLYWFPNQNEGGIISFWAMTYEPSSGFDSAIEAVAEPLVMIRDHVRENIVYLFSFTDIESATAFLREEIRHGIDLGAMMLYWAVPVRMAADPWGKMILTPSVAPGMERPAEPGGPQTDIWSPPPAAPVFEAAEPSFTDAAHAIFEEAANAHTGVAEPMVPGMETFELTSWVEKPRESPSEGKNTTAKLREWLAQQEVPADEPPVASAKNKKTAAELREWLARQEVATIEPHVKTRGERSAKDKKTAAELREWLARQEVAPEKPPVETRREPLVVAKEETPDVAVSEPIIEVAASRVEEVATAPTRAEQPTPIVQAVMVVETAPVTEPVAAAPVETAAAELQMGVAEAVEAIVEPTPRAVAQAAPIVAEAPAEEEAVEAQMIVAEVVEAVIEATPEVVAEPEPEPIAATAEPPTIVASYEAETVHQEPRVEATTTDGASEPEIQRATIRVHTNGNGNGRQYADRHESQERDVSPEEAGAGVHENGNGHEKAAHLQAYVRTSEVEYENGNGAHPEPSVDIRIEIRLDSSRALKVKRWEAKEEPFDGFNSPPGRF